MRLLKGATLAAIIFGMCVVPTFTQASNIVQNGDFSLGSTGWTYNPSSSYPWTFSTITTPTYASTGCVGQQCITGPMDEQAYLYQDLATTVGDSYTLTFSYEDAGNPSELQALFGGSIADDLLNQGSTGLLTYSVSGLVATSSVTELEFLARQDPGYNELTDISVMDNGPSGPSAVPEPGSLALFGTGILGLAGMARKRRVS